MELLLTFVQTKQFIYFLVALFSIMMFVVLCKKYKLSKYQILIFILLSLFWSSVVIFRSYRKTYAFSAPEVGGLGLGELAAVSITSIYGFISIFVRLPIFIVTDFLKSRKFFIGISMVAVLVTSILVYFSPSYITLYCSSLAIGIAASFLSLFNVMFAESFDSKNAILSVSILSIAPLMGEFLVAPLQYFATMETIKDYKMLWLISSILVTGSLILLFFVKDNKEKIVNFSLDKMKTVLKNKNFILICVIGVVISLIRFATSGANFVSFVSFEEIGMSALGIAYLDVIFSLFQLIAGVLAGIYLKNKIGVKATLLIGLGFSAIFTMLPVITTSAVLLFWAYSLSGFGYGLTYNILIGLAMQPFTKEYREITMGIYQTFFSIGIYYGDRIYGYIYKIFEKESIIDSYRSVFVVISVITLFFFIFISMYFRKQNKKFLES